LTIFDTPITAFQGLAPKKIILLKKDCEIETFGDLLNWFPFRYVDRTRFYAINEVSEDLPLVQIIGRLENIKMQGSGKGKERLTAILRDNTGTIELVWFQGIKWVEKLLGSGSDYLFYGKFVSTLFVLLIE
jgi:ATP-dependent DNA helicase RecG